MRKSGILNDLFIRSSSFFFFIFPLVRVHHRNCLQLATKTERKRAHYIYWTVCCLLLLKFRFYIKNCLWFSCFGFITIALTLTYLPFPPSVSLFTKYIAIEINMAFLLIRPKDEEVLKTFSHMRFCSALIIAFRLFMRKHTEKVSTHSAQRANFSNKNWQNWISQAIYSWIVMPETYARADTLHIHIRHSTYNQQEEEKKIGQKLADILEWPWVARTCAVSCWVSSFALCVYWNETVFL